MPKEKIIAKIKHSLQYPKITLELMRELKPDKWKRIPRYFITDALRELNKVDKLLTKLKSIL